MEEKPSPLRSEAQQHKSDADVKRRYAEIRRLWKTGTFNEAEDLAKHVGCHKITVYRALGIKPNRKRPTPLIMPNKPDPAPPATQQGSSIMELALAKLPDFNPEWSAGAQEAWMNALTSIISVLRPIGNGGAIHLSRTLPLSAFRGPEKGD